MNPSANPAVSDELQFDHVASPPEIGFDTPRTVTCATCRTTLTTAYFNIDGEPACAACKARVEANAQPVREWGAVLRAAVFGFGAALVGAAIYYGVIALFELEIGIVAILTGYLVGTAVRKGAGDRGGRRLQLLAVALVYLSVAMAYLPLAIQGIMSAGDADAPAAVADGAAQPRQTAPAAVSDDAATVTVAEADADAAEPAAGDGEESLGAGGMFIAFGAILFLTLTLPVLMVVSSLPGGLLSALIIGFGMHQAWQMTGTPTPTIQGPFRVAPSDPATEAAPA